MIVPCSIHSEIIIRVGEVFAPNSCKRFGCLNCLHKTTSRQNSYPAPISTCHVFVEQSGNERSHLFHAVRVPRVNPQNLDSDSGTPIYATPYVCIATSPESAYSNPPQLVGQCIRGRQLPVLETHLLKHHREPFPVMGTQRGILPRTLVDVS